MVNNTDLCARVLGLWKDRNLVVIIHISRSCVPTLFGGFGANEFFTFCGIREIVEEESTVNPSLSRET